jgi:hypothetical protein
MSTTNLAPAQVNLDYIQKDFNSTIDALITYASTNYGPGTPSNRSWTSFNYSSFSRTFLELVGYVSDVIFYYLDNQATEAYLESATLQSSILNIANQFSYTIPTASSAGGIANFTTTGAASIPAGFIVSSTSGVQFFTTQAASTAVAGTLNVSVLQGTQTVDSFVANGIQNETFTLSQNGIVVDTTNIVPSLRSPIVTVNAVTWTQVQSFIESYPTSQNYMLEIGNNGVATIVFGDGILGAQLTNGAQVQVSYRTGGGSIGNIAANTLTSLGSSAANVTAVNNSIDFSGGTDAPTISQLQSLIPASLSTLERAVTLQDYADIILLNFTGVSQASASTSNVQVGTDVNIYVVPVASTVTPITSNPNLLASIGSFLNIHKMVTSQYAILNAVNLPLQIAVTIYVSANASQSVVQSNVIAALNAYFAFGTGTISPNGTGPTFAQEILLANVYAVIDAVEGIDRFEITELNYQPQVTPRTVNVNPLTFNEIESLPNSGVFEYFVVTETIPPNIDGSPIGQYEVYQRQYFTTTNISDNSITDSSADFSVLTSTGILIGSVVRDQGNQIFSPNQYARGYLLLDSNNNVFKIISNNVNSITIDPISISPGADTFTNGTYYIIQDLRDISFGGTSQHNLLLNNQIISIQYNNLNTLFVITGAELLTIGTLGDPFIVSTKLTLPLVRSNIISTALFPTIQLSPVLISDLALGAGVLSYPAGEYSNYNPITGLVTLQDSNDLSEIVPGDVLIDSNNVSYPILSNIDNTPGSKSVTIQSLPNLVPSFTPNSYNNVTGFLSVPDSVNLANVSAGDVYVDYNGILYLILGGVVNTPGSKGFNIQTFISPPPSSSIGATIYQGIGQVGTLEIVGFGNINQLQPGSLLEDSNGVVGLINSINYAANQVTLDLNSSKPAIGLCELSTTTQIPIPEMSTSINTTSQPDVFILGTYLTGNNAKIVPGDLLIDNTGVANEILQVPYVSFANPNTVTYTYSITPDTIEVFTNSAPVAYTYNLSSGLIQYASTVDLSAVDIGDQFQDGNGAYYTIAAVNYSGNAVIIPPGQSSLNSSSGGSIFNGSSRGLIQYSSSVNLSQVLIGDYFRDGLGTDYIIDTFSTALNIIRIGAAPVSIGLSPGVSAGGSVRSFNKVQLAPGYTTPQIGTGATLTRQFFTPDNGITWNVSYNGLNANVGYSNINDLGLEPTTSNPADQFTLQTTTQVGDIVNVGPSMIPTLNQSNIILTLLGGNS